jgi:c-di-GMP-binding flagellar brake protein YcgR
VQKEFSVGEEKRQFPRVEVTWPVTMLTAQGPIEGKVKNISFGGAFVHCQEQPGSNETFRMIIKVPHARQFLRASARVARSNIYNPESTDEPRGVGVRFVEISDNDRQYIREVVAEQQ